MKVVLRRVSLYCITYVHRYVHHWRGGLILGILQYTYDVIYVHTHSLTVNDSTPFDASRLGKVESDKLPKATGVVVVDCLGIAKRLKNRTA